MLVWFLVRIPALIVRQQQRSQALAAFAAANDFSYQGAKVSLQGRPAIATGSILNLPYESITVDRVLDRLSGTLRGLPFEYTSTTVKLVNPLNNKKWQRSMPVAVIFFRLGVPADMPRLYLEPKDGYHKGIKLPATLFKDPWRYVLEGNFRDHYTIIGERQQRVDVLTVLSPEVMEALISHAFYDIWMHDNEIVLIGYGAGREQYFKHLVAAFTVSNMLTAQVDRISRALHRAKR